MAGCLKKQNCQCLPPLIWLWLVIWSLSLTIPIPCTGISGLLSWGAHLGCILIKSCEKKQCTSSLRNKICKCYPDRHNGKLNHTSHLDRLDLGHTAGHILLWELWERSTIRYICSLRVKQKKMWIRIEETCMLLTQCLKSFCNLHLYFYVLLL